MICLIDCKGKARLGKAEVNKVQGNGRYSGGDNPPVHQTTEKDEVRKSGYRMGKVRLDITDMTRVALYVE